jgi:hypothetical protein
VFDRRTGCASCATRAKGTIQVFPGKRKGNKRYFSSSRDSDRPQVPQLVVVNEVFKQMKNHLAFETLFDVSESHDDEEACVTYFWLVVLGGNKLSDFDSEVVRGVHGWASAPPCSESGSRCFAKRHFP